MSLDGIQKGNYGFPIEITLTESGTAANLSAYASGTVQYVFADPDGTLGTVSAAFKAGGDDGVLTYTVGSALFTSAGDWALMPRVSQAGTVIAGEVLYFTVGRVLE